jgi:hypothetical protein
MNIEMAGFCEVTPHTMEDGYYCFGGTLLPSSGTKMRAAGTFETITNYYNAWCYIAEDLMLLNKNVAPYTFPAVARYIAHLKLHI